MKEVLLQALPYYGLKEIKGAEHNAQVVEFFHEIGHEWVQDDETAWCAAFVGAVLKRAGYEHTGKLNARSYLDIGWEPTVPEPGDLVILWRNDPNSWQGHVGFWVNEDEQHVHLLGGNQSNQVNIAAYDRGRILGYRRLKKL